MLPSTDEPQGVALRTFFESLKLLNVNAQYAPDLRSTFRVLKGIAESSHSEAVVTAGLPMEVLAVVNAAFDGKEVRAIESLGREEARDVISRADTGVTWAEGGIPEQGAIMEVVYDDAAKLASSLPLVHVALLSHRKMLDLRQAMQEVGRLVRSSPPERKPTVSFISGPSRTGDIEMRLLLGVHGPHAMHVVALGWQ